MSMTTEDKRKTFNEIVGAILEDRPMNFTKSDLKDAGDALDDLLKTPAFRATIDKALPEPFKTRATLRDKAMLLAFVSNRLAGR